MSTEAASPPAAPAAAPQTVKTGGVTFTRETVTAGSEPQGAQGVRPAPAGIIPPPLKPIAGQVPDRGTGPARKAMLEELQRRAKPALTHENEARKTAAAEAAKKTAAASDAMDDGVEEAGSDTSEVVSEVAQPAASDKKKVNPWKLVDQHKAARANLEAELAELKKVTSDAAGLKQQLAEIEKIKSRNSELEGAIALIDARKSEKFQKEYQKPYEKAWQKSMQDLRSLQIEDAKSGENRAIQPNDLLKVVNLGDDVEARDLAEEMFGEENASLVMRKREIIRDLYDKQQEYLEEVSKNGSQTIAQSSEQQQKLMGELQKQWEAASEELINNDKMKPYFAPIDGDEAATEKLTKGYEFVDEAMKGNPSDPKLTADERSQIIKKHAAVRHRAAAFTRLTYMNSKKDARIAELAKRLSQYEDAEPATTSGVRTPAANTGVRKSAWDSVREALYAKASK